MAEPGNVDLSCNVDFSALRRAALEMKGSGTFFQIFILYFSRWLHIIIIILNTFLSSHGIFTFQGGVLKKNEKIKVWGPITQSDFLLEMGIEARLAQLLVTIKDEQIATQQITAFNRLISSEQMGTVYKVLAITNLLTDKSQPLPGFSSLSIKI